VWEAFFVDTVYIQSLDFVINRFFMELFATSNIEIVKCCQEYFGFPCRAHYWPNA